MNPDDSDQLTMAIRSQCVRLRQQEEQMTSMHQGFEALAKRQDDAHTSLTTQVNLLSAQVQQVLAYLVGHLPSLDPKTTPPSFHTTALCLSSPDKISGELGECRSFIVDCEMYYEHYPSAFPTERSKVAEGLTLTGVP